MDKNTCPLCNNCGVNSLKDIGTLPWSSRNAAFMNFKRVRAFSRRKTAPQGLKKQIASIKKSEDKQKQFMKEFKEFKKSTPEEMTVQNIITKHNKMRRKKWTMTRSINRKKTLVGFTSNIINNIIIPVKKTF